MQKSNLQDPYSFTTKTSIRQGWKNHLQYRKWFFMNPKGTSFSWWKTESHSSKIRYKARFYTLTALTECSTGSPFIAIGHKSDIKTIQLERKSNCHYLSITYTQKTHRTLQKLKLPETINLHDKMTQTKLTHKRSWHF